MTLILLIILTTFRADTDALCTGLDFHESSTAHSTTFLPSDLEALMAQPKAVALKLRIATCCLSGDDHELDDEDSSRPGVQHTFAIATIKGGGEIRDMAAAPCPPHCNGEKLAEVTTVAEFLGSH